MAGRDITTSAPVHLHAPRQQVMHITEPGEMFITCSSWVTDLLAADGWKLLRTCMLVGFGLAFPLAALGLLVARMVLP